jgi:hypothetical protein
VSQQGNQLALSSSSCFPKETFQVYTNSPATYPKVPGDRGHVLTAGQSVGNSGLGGRQEKQIPEQILVGMGTILHIENHNCGDRFATDV